jgi:hypothetical protein
VGLQLHLGVLVQPYRGKGLTTGDVAGFLEHKYGVMGTFFQVHEKDVIEALEGSMLGAFEALVMRQYVDPWGRGTQKIEQAFRTFISSREAERVGIPGTPTKAALRGVNHRLAHPYARANARRPSFRDTGMYMNSFRAWVDRG